MKRLYVELPVLILTALMPALAHAQRATPHDTSYFVTYTDKMFMARVYASQKYALFTIPSAGTLDDAKYRSNSKLNAGIGATYKNFTLNVSLGVSGNDEKGKTKGIDFQFHLTPYAWVIDALASFHKGNYLHPKGYAALVPSGYYYRPDVELNLIGLAAYRLANPQRFSYRAALIQNEWQVKSAGSLLYGGNVYYGVVKGDSSIIPARIASQFSQAGINDISFISLGPGVGYAYTLVIAKHVFINGSLIGNLDVNFSAEKRGGGKENKTSVSPSGIYKVAAGYNANSWSLVANLLGNFSWVKGSASSKDYLYDMGMIRLMLAKKIGQ